MEICAETVVLVEGCMKGSSQTAAKSAASGMAPSKDR